MEEKPKFTIEENQTPEQSNNEPDRSRLLPRSINIKLYKAQAMIPPLEKKGWAWRNKQRTMKRYYLTLDTIVETLRPIQKELGFGYYFSESEGFMNLVVFDESGSLTSKIRMIVDGGQIMNQVQGVGSTVTYCRRYLLGMMFSISTEEDDDAQSVGKGKPIPEVDIDQINPLDYRISVISKHKGKLLTECHGTELIGELNYWGDRSKTEEIGGKLLTELKVIRKYINSIKEEAENG